MKTNVKKLPISNIESKCELLSNRTSGKDVVIHISSGRMENSDSLLAYNSRCMNKENIDEACLRLIDYLSWNRVEDTK